MFFLILHFESNYLLFKLFQFNFITSDIIVKSIMFKSTNIFGMEFTFGFKLKGLGCLELQFLLQFFLKQTLFRCWFLHWSWNLQKPMSLKWHFVSLELFSIIICMSNIRHNHTPAGSWDYWWTARSWWSPAVTPWHTSESTWEWRWSAKSIS